MPQTIQFYQIGGLEVRDAYLGSLQFQPVDALTVQADVFYTEFSTDTTRDGVSLQGSASYAIANPRLVEGNYAVGGLFYDSTNIFVVSGDTSDDDDVLSSGLNVEYAAGSWSIALDASHSSASGNQADGYHYANVYRRCTEEDPVCTRTGYTRDNGQVHWQSDGLRLPNMAFGVRMDDFNTLRMTQYGKYPRLSEDEVSAVKVDLEFDLASPVFQVVRFGARQSQRDYAYGRQVFQYGPGSGYVHDVDMPITEATGDVVCWGGDYSHFPCFISFDAEAILRQAVEQNLVLQCDPQAVYNCDEDQLGPDGRPLPRSTETIARWGLNNRSAWSVRQRGDVGEDVLAYYVEADLETEVMGRSLSGNVGVRVVDTEQSSVAIYDVYGDPALNAEPICDGDGRCRDNFAYVTFTEQYKDVFPSLNLNYLLSDELYLRFGAAKVMSRPPINRLSSDQPVDGGGGNFIDDSTASEGYVTFNFSNTNSTSLRPFEAVQVDLSLERYFGDTGLFAIAAYHKDIKSFIQDLTIPEFDFRANGFVIPETYEAVVLDPETGGAVITPGGGPRRRLHLRHQQQGGRLHPRRGVLLDADAGCLAARSAERFRLQRQHRLRRQRDHHRQPVLAVAEPLVPLSGAGGPVRQPDGILRAWRIRGAPRHQLPKCQGVELRRGLRQGHRVRGGDQDRRAGLLRLRQWAASHAASLQSDRRAQPELLGRGVPDRLCAELRPRDLSRRGLFVLDLARLASTRAVQERP